MGVAMGYVQVYTGNGKGKTTAAFGLAMRAAGRGMNVCVIQFMKPDAGYGEQISARKLGIEVHALGTNRFVNKNNPSKEDVERARTALALAEEKVKSGEYDIVILDEVNVAINFNLIPVEDVLKILENVPERTEVILTGRYAPDAIIQRADLVTEMREVKHYFRRGVMARKGIEF